MFTLGLATIGGAPFADLMRERVLGRLEALNADFGPRLSERCVATEEDTEWRMRPLRGEVHDENAFAFTGTSGHAGLFRTPADVAAIPRGFRRGAVLGDDLGALAPDAHPRGE